MEKKAKRKKVLRLEMKSLFQKIWKLASPYQDKRDDKNHAKIVTDYAIKLCELENADENIVVPAAILHDIGWSQLSKKEKFSIFKNISKEEERGIRIKHEKEGVNLAKKILKKVNYEPNLIKKILEIIDGHDTRKEFLNKEDGIVRDADKLWRYSQIGFEADTRRFKLSLMTPIQLLKLRKSQVSEKGYFYSQSAKEIAREEIEERGKEFIA